MSAVLLVGAGGHARSCVDVVEQAGLRIAGLVGAKGEVGTSVLGYPVLGSDDDLPQLARGCGAAVVAVGQIRTSDPRRRIYERLRELGFELPVVVSPRAYVSRHASLGEGTVVMHGAVVNAGARVGANCIVNSLALVEHDARLGDHCHLSTAAALNGGASVGDGTFVGSGTIVRESVRIGRACVIGMGLAIVRDCADGTWLPQRKEST